METVVYHAGGKARHARFDTEAHAQKFIATVGNGVVEA